MALIDGYCEPKYKIIDGYIVFPWTDEREELCEYILRADREVADKIASLMKERAAIHRQDFGTDRLKVSSLFSIPRIKRFFRSERKILYYDAVSRRIWREHEEFEEEIMRR
jgi:hypothetical protein